MNQFLKTRLQIDESTKWLSENGYISNPISAKNWELKIITEELQDGDLLEMGADGSRVLHNAVKKKIKGRLVGIDLAEVTGDNRAEGAEYFVGDLMQTPFADGSFATLISQSVIEHEVDVKKFAAECSRLLMPNGELIVSFDYFNPKPDTSEIKLYGLAWSILDKADVLNLVLEMDRAGLSLDGEIDWTIGEPVITPQYCSPGNVSYSFGILKFRKTVN